MLAEYSRPIGDLRFDSLDGADADVVEGRRLSDADTRVERAPDPGGYTLLDSRPAKTLSLRPSPGKPGACPLAYHRRLEFRKDA